MDLTFEDVLAIQTRLTIMGLVLSGAALALILKTSGRESFQTTRKVAIGIGLFVALYVSSKLFQLPQYGIWWLGLWSWFTDLLIGPSMFVLIVFAAGGAAWVLRARFRGLSLRGATAPPGAQQTDPQSLDPPGR